MVCEKHFPVNHIRREDHFTVADGSSYVINRKIHKLEEGSAPSLFEGQSPARGIKRKELLIQRDEAAMENIVNSVISKDFLKN